jgi:DNA polymerase I-like protein with 3'-5' exonuclease and polymerase domains
MHLPNWLYDYQVYARPDARFVVLDFETTNLEFGTALNKDNRLLCACWLVAERDGSLTKKQAIGGELDMRELVQDIQAADFVVAHNAKFELQWLKRCGMELRDTLPWCTKVAQWVLDGNLRKGRSLEEIGQRYFNEGKESLVSKMIREYGIKCEDISMRWLVAYCHKDVELTYRLFREQLTLLGEQGMLHLVHQRNLTCACLADIEFNGMHLDPARVEQEYQETLATQQQLKKELDDLCGGINLNSTQQLAKLLYETLKFTVPRTRYGKPLRTDGGNLPTDADTIDSLTIRTKKQEKFVTLFKQYRRATSLLQKNLDFFKRVVTERGGIFQAEFNQGSTATGRLSSSGRKIVFSDGTEKGCQFQNMPRNYKKLFSARREGYLIAECDGSQLEFRTAGGMSQDPVALDEIAHKVDVHQITADTLTAAGEPTTRQEAKASTFKPLYGGTRGTPAQEAYVKFFNNKYKRIAEMQKGWVYEVLKTGQLTTPYGLKLYWPNRRMRTDGTADCQTEVYNYPVQGLATGEIIPIALIAMWHLTRDTDIMVVNTIHDSIICEIPQHEVDRYKQIALHSMTFIVYDFLRRVYDYELKVNLGTGIKIAHNWADTKSETSYDVTPEGKVATKEK